MYKILLVAFILLPSLLVAQKTLNHEFDLTIDNDVFLGPGDKDRYYSSGIYLSYRNAVKPESAFHKFFNKKEQIHNLLQGFHIGQIVYTSDNIIFTDVALYDRPYAGLHTFGYSLNLFKKNNWVFNGKFDLGILGPSSQVDDVQTNWHNFFGLPDPAGWVNQVNDSPIINLKIEATKSFLLAQGVDFLYESKYEAGTVFNNIRQGGVIRLGKIKNLNESGYLNGLIGTKYQEDRRGQQIEGYFFLGTAVEYVFYNSTIQGNIIGEETDFTDEKIDWIWHWKFGFNLHWQTFDFGYHVYLSSPENELAGRHAFGRLRFSKRF